MASFKKVFRRLLPLILTAAGAAASSGSFRHYIESHPQFAPIALAVVAALHALDEKTSKPSA